MSSQIPDPSRVVVGERQTTPEIPSHKRFAGVVSRTSRRGGDQSTGKNIVGGLVRGIQEDPILGTLFDEIVELFPDAAEENINALVSRSAGSRLADVSAIVGEFGPSFILAGGAFGLGRAAAVGGLARVGGKKGLESGLGRLAGRQLTRAEQVKKFGKEGADRLIEQPLVERLARIGGGSVGIGAFSGAEAAVDGAPIDDVAKAALTTAIFAGVFEGALFGLTKLPVIGLKSAKDPTGANKRFAEKALPELKKEGELLNTKLEKITNQIKKTLGVEGQQRELFRGAEMARIRTPEAQKKLAGQTQALRAVKLRIKALKDFEKTPVGAYMRGEPYDPKGFFETLALARLNTIQTPESFRGQLGRTMNKFIEEFDKAESLTKLSESVIRAKLKELQAGLAPMLGLRGRKAHDGLQYSRLVNAHEKFGPVGVRNFMNNEGRGKFAEDAVKLLENHHDDVLKQFNILAKMGAQKPLSLAELQGLGVSRFWPHVTADLPERDVVAKLAKEMGEFRAQSLFNEQNRKGLAKFGSIDFQRNVSGSLAEKTQRGLPFNANPFDATERYLSAVHRRIHYAKPFGLNGEMREPILKAAIAEGANPKLSHSLVDLALNHQYHDQALQQFARTVTGLEIASKLGLAVIPNMSQSINTITFNGINKFAKGLATATNKSDRQEVMRGVALAESVVESMGRTFGQTTSKVMAEGTGTGFTASANLFDKFSHGVLKYTGFSTVERWNRVLAGATGWHVMRDTIAKSVDGRLKGINLDVARRRMQTLGMDLDDVTDLARRTGDDFMNSPKFAEIVTLGMFKSSATTQFNPTKLRKPILWNHPAGRVMAQFKTFALGQGRFIRDQVFAEAQQGNLRPLAYFASIYPIAGEVLAQTKSIVKFKDRNSFSITGNDDFDRVIQDYTMVGGLGILSDMFTSARFGNVLGGVFGPTVSDVGTLFENLAQGKENSLLNMVLKTPTAQATKFSAVGLGTLGGFGMQEMQNYLDTLDSEETDPTKTVVDLGVLRTTPR